MFIQSLQQPEPKVQPYCMTCWQNDIAKRGRVPGLIICEECEARLSDDDRERLKAKNPKYRLWLACNEVSRRNQILSKMQQLGAIESAVIAFEKAEIKAPPPPKTTHTPQQQNRVRFQILDLLEKTPWMSTAKITAQMPIDVHPERIKQALTKCNTIKLLEFRKTNRKAERYEYRLTQKGLYYLICLRHNVTPGKKYINTLMCIAVMGGTATFPELREHVKAEAADIQSLKGLGFIITDQVVGGRGNKQLYRLTNTAWEFVKDLQKFNEMEMAS